MQFDGPVAAFTLFSAQFNIGHMVSRQRLAHTTPRFGARHSCLDAPDTIGKPSTRALGHIALAAGITQALLIVIAVDIYVSAFMILSPLMG